MDAVKLYEKIAEKKDIVPKSIYEKLGNAYYFNGEYVQAAKWYSEVFKDASYNNTEAMYRYSIALKSNGEYEKANMYLDMFSKQVPSDARSVMYNSNTNYLERIEQVSNRGELELVDINSELSDYGGFIYDSLFVFTSNRKIPRKTKQTHTWTDEPFSNVYQATLDKNYKLSDVKILEGKDNIKYNEYFIKY